MHSLVCAFYMHAHQNLMGIKARNSEYDQKITNCRQIRGITRMSHTTITKHQEDKQSKATSSLFPIKMIAKWTQSYAQQNIEQLQNPTIGVTINIEINNNRTTALERAAAKATRGLKFILLVPNLRPRFCCC